MRISDERLYAIEVEDAPLTKREKVEFTQKGKSQCCGLGDPISHGLWRPIGVGEYEAAINKEPR